MKKIRIFSLTLVVLFILLSVPIPTFGATIRPSDIKNTDVMTDLPILEAYSKNKDKYVKDATVEYCEIIEFLEMGYSYETSRSATYWLYVFNPSGKEIDTSSEENLVSIMAGTIGSSNSGKIRKHKLSFNSKSGDNLFYKFRVSNDNLFEAEVSKGIRHYTITDLEFKYKDEYYSRSVKCSGQWAFSGYDVNCGNNSANQSSTLIWTSKNIITLDLDLNGATWKSKTSSKGIGYQNEMFSCYFAVPNYIINEYGDSNDPYKGLVEVYGSYNNVLVTGLSVTDTSLYEDLLNYVGKAASTTDIPYGFYTEPYKDESGASYVRKRSYYAFNPNPFWWQFNAVVQHVYDQGMWTFGDVYKGTLSGVTESSFLDQIEDKRDTDSFLAYKGSADSNYYTVTNKDEKGNVINLAEQMASMSDVSGSYDFWDWIKGIPAYDDESYTAVSPLRTVGVTDVESLTYTDEYLASQLYVSDEDFPDLEAYVKNNSVTDTVFLMRFAITDYYNSDIFLCRAGGGDTGSDIDFGNGNYYFRKEVFLDFDILSLTWEKENGDRTVLPITSTPIDIVGSVETTPPAEDNFFAEFVGLTTNIRGGCNSLESLKPTFIVVSLLALFVVISSIPALNKLCGKLFDLLGSGISKLFGLPRKLLDADKERDERKARKRKERREAQAERDENEERKRKKYKEFSDDFKVNYYDVKPDNDSPPNNRLGGKK